MHSGFTNSMIATFNDGNWHDIEIYIHNDSSAFSNSLNSYVKIDNNHKLSLDSNHEDGSHYSKYRNGSGALVGKLFINGHGGGLNSEMKPLHYNGDMKDFEIYENGTLRYSFLKSIVVKTTSVLENQSVYNAESAGFKHGLGDKTYYSGYDKFHVPIYPNLDSESVLSDGGKRYKLIKVEGTGSASVASSSCNINTMSFLEDKCSLSLNSFYLGEDSTLKYTWQEQYKVNVAASGKDIADTISLNVTPLGGTSYTLAPGSRDYWLPKNAKVEVVVNAKDGDGKVLSSAQFAGKSLTNTKNTSTQRTYKLTDSLNSTGEARFHYSTQQWSLKTKVTRPINLDGSLVFSDSYAGLLNTLATPVQDGANSQISEKKFDHDSTIEPLVKTTIYDPNNPYVRYQLAEIYGTGSAKHLTGVYKSGDNINFESFKITDNTTIEYTWKKQHLINVGASASKLKGSPIVKIDSTNVIGPKVGSVVLNGHDLDISFQYKLSSGQLPNVRDVFFSIGSPSSSLISQLIIVLIILLLLI